MRLKGNELWPTPCLKLLIVITNSCDSNGPFIPFGALVSFLPSTLGGKEAVHPMGSKTIQGVFAGYHQAVGGMWSGDLYVVPLRNIKEYNQAKPHCRRISAGDVNVEKKRAMRKTQRTASSSLLPKLKRDMGKRLEALKKSRLAHRPPPLMSPLVLAHREV